MFQKLIGTIPKHKCQWVICDSCRGHGRRDNPAFSNGFTSEEWSEMTHDYLDDGETAASRYLAGDYDVPCTDCRGSGKQLVPDMAMLSFAEKRPFAEARRQARIDAEIAREWAAEARQMERMGA